MSQKAPDGIVMSVVCRPLYPRDLMMSPWNCSSLDICISREYDALFLLRDGAYVHKDTRGRVNDQRKGEEEPRLDVLDCFNELHNEYQQMQTQ
jgi:hypothetical protein